jgi:MinD-like ATPase involved in chromosome partitioning or flagellar assembly
VYTITFYSFKGGVGRTLALANVGARLAQMGRKVLLVDFDLEAPGLETFDHLRPPEPHAGLVEYVTEYVQTKQSPDVSDYIYAAPADAKLQGQIWVMPAGRRDANYQAALTRINWKKLYEDCEGFLCFEDMKAQWEQEFKPDYVLIDSRTGHTDVKGICTRQLPDAVVVLFFPNEQNLVGLKAVCQEIRSEREHGLQKTIGLHFVMSNVPDLDDQDKVLKHRLKAFEEDLGIRKLSGIIHRYESVKLFNQAIFVLDERRSRLAREYRKLTKALIRHNPADRQGALQFLHRADPENYRDMTYRNLWNEDLEMADQGLPAGEDLVNKILEQHLDDADLIYEVANTDFGGESRDEATTIGRLDRVLALRPDHQRARYDRAQLKWRAGDVSGAVSDLFQYLRAHGLDSPHGLSALQDLRAAAPERLAEAVDCAVARGIAHETKYKLARSLAGTHQGALSWITGRVGTDSTRARKETELMLARAVEFLRGYLVDETDTAKRATATFLLQSYLIRSHRWREVVDLYHTSKADAVGDALSWAVPFNVGMAHWAQCGTVSQGMSEDIGQRLEHGEKTLARLGQQYEPWACGLEAKIWLLWWRGDSQHALRHLAVWTELLEKWTNEGDSIAHWSWWSFWRYREVQFARYRDDCQQLRRMIEGEPIRPAFLDAASGAAQAGA